jgi:type III restriction enzyme
VVGKLQAAVPGPRTDQNAWFEPYFSGQWSKGPDHYKRVAQNLRKTLLFGSGTMPMGLLRDCLDYALNDSARFTGVFDAIRNAFRFQGSKKLWEEVSAIYDFRNTFVAHQEGDALTNVKQASAALGRWIRGLRMLLEAVAPNTAH